jgi:GntR family transcriptional regulator, arabinose operon transcriptional repressor
MSDIKDNSTVADAGAGTKHAQLRLALESEIANGAYLPGHFLPSEPELARRFSLSRSTVRQALFSLEQDGVVERHPGKGTVVRDREAVKNQPHMAAFAIVLPEIQSGHYPALVDGFAAAASDLHYQILVCTTGNETSRQGDIILQLLDKRVAGVALLPPTVGNIPDYQLRQLQSQGIPIVMLHRAIESVPAPVVAISFEDVIIKAAESLLSRGHRRIALLASHRSEAVNRYEAALSIALRKAGSELPSELIKIGASKSSQVGPARTREIDEALASLLTLPEDRRPTAIIDPWDSDMEACYFSLLRAGIEPPNQISLVSFGGASRLNVLAKRLTAVTVDEPATAKLTAQLLDQMTRGVRSISDASRFLAPLGFHQGETIAEPAATPPRWPGM